MEATLEVQKRESRGKNEARRLRATGRVPAVIYGSQQKKGIQESIAISVDPKLLMRILHSDSGVNTLINLQLEGKSVGVVMVKEYQLDPVTRALLHTDFYRLALDKTATVMVPVQVRGEAAGIRLQGGILDFVTRDIEVECLPADIPEHVEIDVTELMIGQGLRVKDLAEHEKWKPVSDGEIMIAHVVAPKVEEEPESETVETEEGVAAEGATAEGASTEPGTEKPGKAEKAGEEPSKK
jgi:large subunit ribosomal protein L25|tara:strand:- start:106 stop:822 length:717 start_codon:yes stop_codon:yes gene_type:complete